MNYMSNIMTIFKAIASEYGSFHNYLRTFTDDRIIYEIDKTTNDLSDAISKDLQNSQMLHKCESLLCMFLYDTI
ncbi:MAG: DNA-3-methyladenine glycosylase I [Tyzzerella sp.]|nr:DNA-3-methyladenine glycosylase I [Tyzzerella sp.]